MKKIKLDHVERLSRGKRSGAQIGSRAVGHHLKPHERADYERALKKGYLDITDKDRANLWHIWEKACKAKDCAFLVLVKEPANGIASIYNNTTPVGRYPINLAKQEIKKMVNAHKS